MVQNHVGPMPWTQFLGSIPRTKYHGPNTTDQNLVFQHVRTFPSMKVHVYDICAFVYSEPACIRGLVYSELAYTFLSSFLLFTCYTVIFHLRDFPSRTTLVSYLYHNSNRFGFSIFKFCGKVHKSVQNIDAKQLYLNHNI